MKKWIFLLASCFFLSGVLAQSVVNDRNAQVRTVTAFHAIKVSTGIHLYLVQGNEEKVVVSAADETYRNRIRTEVEGGVLHIYYDNQIWKWSDFGRKELKAYVSCKSLDGLSTSSGAQVEVDGILKSANLAMNFSSGSRFSGKVEAGVLSLDGSSGAKATLAGKAGDLRAEASSGSKLSGYDLAAGKCDVRVSSGAHIDISVEKEMAASAHSGGHVNYQGTGVIREVHTGSGGSVSRR